MRISAYLSSSRHGVYYFRWPLPLCEGHKRHSIKLSLRTKCPDRAGDLARHLASCGRLVRENKTLAKLRQDEMAKLRQDEVRAVTKKITDLILSVKSTMGKNKQVSCQVCFKFMRSDNLKGHMKVHVKY